MLRMTTLEDRSGIDTPTVAGADAHRSTKQISRGITVAKNSEAARLILFWWVDAVRAELAHERRRSAARETLVSLVVPVHVSWVVTASRVFYSQ